jgi:hypothetical protein
VISGTNAKTIEDLMKTTAASDLGAPLNTIANHVILCMPRGTIHGTSTNWIGYAYVNHWLSVFNDNWCQSPSALMHEIGK